MALFATAFSVMAATTPDPVTIAAAPIEVPATTQEQATVLAPVAVGDASAQAGEAAPDLSPEVGSATVTVPADLGSDDSGPLDGPLPPASVLSEAAALDASAGAVEDTVARSESSEPTAEPSPGDTSAPASDPCATDAAGEGCPEGVTATLFSLESAEDLEVFAAADPATGPGMGSSIYCPATDPGTDALRLGAITTTDAAVTVSYWPEGDPEAIETTELEHVGDFVDGGSRFCGATVALEEGMYEGTAIAISPAGEISDAYPLRFDSRGAPILPTMRVVPLGTNWLWVGVPHTIYESALIDGFAATDAGVEACEDARAMTPLRADVASHTTVLSPETLRARNWNGAFTRSTSVLLYVPSGTTVQICGATYANDDPSWDRDVPESLHSVIATAPDAWTATVTVRNVSTYRPGQIRLTGLGQTGSRCGRAAELTVDHEFSDTATVTPLGDAICTIAGQNIQIEAKTWYVTDAGSSATEETTRRFMIAAPRCDGVCPEPEPATYTIFLPGLGQDECPDSIEDDCDLRRRTAGAWATVDVTWMNEGEGLTGSWSTGGVTAHLLDGDPPVTPQFDEDARFTGALDPRSNFRAQATATLRWDRPVSYTAEAIGDCYAEGATTSFTGGRTRSAGSGVHEASVTLTNLCPGTTYYTVIRYTDDDGNAGVATSPGTPGVTSDVPWWPSMFQTPQKYLRIKAAISMQNIVPEGSRAAFLIRDSFLYVDGDALLPSFGAWQHERCFPSSVAEVHSESGVVVVPLREEYTLTQDFNVYSDFFFHPRREDCTWRWQTQWIEPTARTLTLTQLLGGLTFDGELQDREFPTNARPFTYDVKMTASIQDSPTDS